MRNLSAASLFLLLFAAGCAEQSPLACPTSANRTARIFFATDRRRVPAPSGLRFGPDRTHPPGLNLGSEQIALGAGHRLGKLDDAVALTPQAILQFTPSADRLDAMRRADAGIDAFANSTLRPAIRASARAGRPRHVLLFVHGFNTTFDEAIRKTAQFSGDLGFVDCAGQSAGVAITYSWPAEGQLLGYLADEENAEWTEQRLAPFLRAVARVCREEGAHLHLLSHSMGARALIRSLADLANGCEKTGRLADDVILLAPDMGKGLFEQYVDRVLPTIGHLTIYVSARDHALSISSFLHGGHERLGLIESTVYAALQLTGLAHRDHRELGAVAETAPPGKIDMIDVTHSLANHFGHSYEDPAFIRDLRRLIVEGAPAGAGSRGNLTLGEIHQSIFFGRAGEGLRYFRLQTQ